MRRLDSCEVLEKCDRTINSIKRRYGLEDAEIHTGWIMRTYLEQSRIPDFETLSFDDRRRSRFSHFDPRFVGTDRPSSDENYPNFFFMCYTLAKEHAIFAK